MGPNGALSGPDGGAQGMMGGPNRPGQRAQDLQGRLTVSEGHGYPLVIIIHSTMAETSKELMWSSFTHI